MAQNDADKTKLKVLNTQLRGLADTKALIHNKMTELKREREQLRARLGMPKKG